MKVTIELNEQERAKIYAAFDAALKEMLPVCGEFTVVSSNVQFHKDSLHYASFTLACSPNTQPNVAGRYETSGLDVVRQQLSQGVR